MYCTHRSYPRVRSGGPLSAEKHRAPRHRECIIPLETLMHDRPGSCIQAAPNVSAHPRILVTAERLPVSSAPYSRQFYSRSCRRIYNEFAMDKPPRRPAEPLPTVNERTALDAAKEKVLLIRPIEFGSRCIPRTGTSFFVRILFFITIIIIIIIKCIGVQLKRCYSTEEPAL